MRQLRRFRNRVLRFMAVTTAGRTMTGPLLKELLMQSMARGLGLFWGGFALANLFGDLIAPGFDVSVWIIDLSALATWLSRLLLLVTGMMLLMYALWPGMAGLRRSATLALAMFCVVISAIDALRYWILLGGGVLHGGRALPMSVLTLASFLMIAMCLFQQRPVNPDSIKAKACAVAVACGSALAFPVLQMMLFGRTDYRRPADAIVVFGARAYADGRPSDALADRVRTACDLFREGLAPRIIMSGGPGDGAIHETEAMMRMAMGLGVPEGAIVLDPDGLNTRRTIQFIAGLDQSDDPTRVLAVSHAYHLPRVKIAFERAGMLAYTVPARERYVLTKMPLLMAREVAAFWLYFLNAAGQERILIHQTCPDPRF